MKAQEELSEAREGIGRTGLTHSAAIYLSGLMSEIGVGKFRRRQ